MCSLPWIVLENTLGRLPHLLPSLTDNTADDSYHPFLHLRIAQEQLVEFDIIFKCYGVHLYYSVNRVFSVTIAQFR